MHPARDLALVECAATGQLDLDCVCRHGKNLNSDVWRQMQLRKATTGRRDHPFAKFATGSYETLMSGPEVLPPSHGYLQFRTALPAPAPWHSDNARLDR